MTGSISLERLPDRRVPAVVAGDLTLVRPHGMADIPVVLATDDPRDVALRSRYVYGHCLVPGFDEANARATVSVLVELGARLHERFASKVPLVHGTDHQLELLYRYHRELSEHYLFTLNPEGLAWTLHDKERFYEVAEAAGIQVPRTRKPGNGPEHGLADLRDPVLIKPRRKTAWAEIQQRLLGGFGKARVFQTKHELCEHPAFEAYKHDLIVQEHVEGGAEALVSFHGYADEHGRILASFCGRKLRTWPRVAGESSFIELTLDRSVREVGTDAAYRLGLRGPFEVDMIRCARTGELFVLEINARFTLWHYLGAVHGVNLPAVAYTHLVGWPGVPIVGPYEPRVRWVDFYRDYKAYKEQRDDGTITLSEWLSSLASGPVVYDTFSWSDPLPLSRWLRTFLQERHQRGSLRNPLRRSR